MKKMNKLFLIPVISGIVIVAIIAALMIPSEEETDSKVLSISYVETNKEIQSLLDLQNISMSSALNLNGFSIEKYCTFFADESIQNAIEYCTSTELLDSNGRYLGNIHMVGVSDSPKYVIGVIQTDPIVSQLNEVKIIYQTMIESLVCDCWEDEKPGGFESVSDWIDAAHIHHLEAKRTTSKSEINGLAQKDVLLEITTNTEGYLWKFIIPN
jgi:inorganic pyrophosphatase